MSFYLLDNAQPVTQQWGYPRRGASLSGTCIIHTAECAMDFDGADSSAENCANFIRTRSDYGSYHTLVDSDSIIEMVPYEYEAWQDSETNPWAVGLSAAVQADNWHTVPADRKDRIYRNLATAAADFVTYMKSKGITVPLKRITGQQARNRVPGFCAHGDSGIDRHDPGVQFDWALFFKYTQQALGGAAIAPQGNTSTAKDWFDMATEAQLRKVIQEENPWTYRNAKLEKDDAYALLRATRTLAVDNKAELAAVKSIVSQLAKNQGVDIDYALVKQIVKDALASGVDVSVSVAGKTV